MVVAKAVPPVAFAYQTGIPPPTLDVAPKTTLPVPQREFGVVLIIVGIVFIVAFTKVLADEQTPFTVST